MGRHEMNVIHPTGGWNILHRGDSCGGPLELTVDGQLVMSGFGNSFDGVDSSYAIQAGREIRIIVKPEKISDADTVIVARNIAKRIENELEYPGQIKVNVIRETRTTEYAK